MDRFDEHKWNLGDTVRSMTAIIRVMGAEALSSIDRRFEDRLNPPDEEVYKPYVFPFITEAPVQTEEELE